MTRATRARVVVVAGAAAVGAAVAAYVWWRRRRRRPRGSVDGVDVYLVDAADADAVVAHLGDDGVLGLDVEWPPTGKPRAAVVQLASEKACVVVRVGAARSLPPKTAALIASSACCGVGVHDDAALLRRDLGVHPGRLVDLRTLARRHGLRKGERDGLAALAAAYSQPSRNLLRLSWLCHVLQGDDARRPALPKSVALAGTRRPRRSRTS